MASLRILAMICLAAAVSSAPQEARERRQVIAPGLRQRALLQPQLIQGGGYIQPQLVQGDAYIQPQLLGQSALLQPQLIPQQILRRRLPVQYAAQPRVLVAPQSAYAAGAVLRQPALANVGRTPAIISQVQDLSPDGSFNFAFESEDGISVQTNAGPAVPVGPEETIQTVSGSFSYTAPDGTPITTNWVADENGYRAEGAHLPRGPLNQ